VYIGCWKDAKTEILAHEIVERSQCAFTPVGLAEKVRETLDSDIRSAGQP
jgi:hypothetical protein